MPDLRHCCLAIALTLLPALPCAVIAETADDKLLSGYSLLATAEDGATVIIGRAILSGADRACPSFANTDGSSGTMPTQARKNPDPVHFPVTVCEAVIAQPMRITGSSRLLPGPPGKIDEIVVVGDSGCKPKDQDGCELGGKQWPLQQISESAAKRNPSVVLHMGDYNYRGTSGHVTIGGNKRQVYDAGDNTDSVSCQLSGPYYGQNSVGSDNPDQWQNWWLDLFQPADALLQAAPWIVARGNHELCSRAGPGWFYLLDTSSDLDVVGVPQRQCPPAESEEPLLFAPPYRVDLQGLSVVVLDSANACDQGDLHQEHFDGQFEQIQQLVDQAPQRGFLVLQSHRPIWAVRRADDSTAPGNTDPSGKYAIIDQTLQSGYHRYPVPRPVHLVVSGHMHRFQATGFSAHSDTPYPDQLVVGNGGVDLAHNHPENPYSFPIDGLTGTGWGTSAFGFMTLLADDKTTWKGDLRDPDGKKIASCEGGVGHDKHGPCKPQS